MRRRDPWDPIKTDRYGRTLGERAYVWASVTLLLVLTAGSIAILAVLVWRW